ncbi:thioredoxin, mitochondrial-like [Oratosquilla oratoria]|uniref:thioredoxin, mitochondrial-like n=1 Tax=Oratosquilla oratoria TaxID=337810 RepID=UPI003F76AD25
MNAAANASGMLKFFLCQNKIPFWQIYQCSHYLKTSVFVASKAQFHIGRNCKDIFEIHGLDDFDNRVIKCKVPVIVNFHADWCEPCHSLKPMLEKIAKENMEKINLAQIIVDEHADLLHAFEVTAVPAVLALHKGQVINKFVGLVSQKQIEDFLHQVLAE